MHNPYSPNQLYKYALLKRLHTDCIFINNNNLKEDKLKTFLQKMCLPTIITYKNNDIP